MMRDETIPKILKVFACRREVGISFYAHARTHSIALFVSASCKHLQRVVFHLRVTIASFMRHAQRKICRHAGIFGTNKGTVSAKRMRGDVARDFGSGWVFQ